MDAKEAIERLNEFVWHQENRYSIHIANGGQDNDEFELFVDDLKLAISALEKVETLEVENARLREKETPKISLKKDLSHYEDGSLCIHFEHYCPVCKHLVESVYDYCGFCGQAIKNKE